MFKLWLLLHHRRRRESRSHKSASYLPQNVRFKVKYTRRTEDQYDHCFFLTFLKTMTPFTAKPPCMVNTDCLLFPTSACSLSGNGSSFGAGHSITHPERHHCCHMSSDLVAAAKLSFIDIGHNGAAMGKDAVFPSCEPGSMTSSIANCVRGASRLAVAGTGPPQTSDSLVPGIL